MAGLTFIGNASEPPDFPFIEAGYAYRFFQVLRIDKLAIVALDITNARISAETGPNSGITVVPIIPTTIGCEELS